MNKQKVCRNCAKWNQSDIGYCFPQHLDNMEGDGTCRKWKIRKPLQRGQPEKARVTREEIDKIIDKIHQSKRDYVFGYLVGVFKAKGLDVL